MVRGPHKPCLRTGVQNGSAVRDFLTLLVSKKVDLVLQRHDHTYRRTRPIASGHASCDVVLPEGYNPDCVANESADTYVKGQGSVFVIAGTAGETETAIDLNNPIAPYFVSTMGTNGAGAHGFMRVVVSRTQLNAAFVTTAGNAFSDAFAISGPLQSPARMDPRPPR